MSAASERSPKRAYKLVGGGISWTRTPVKGTGGSMKAKRRAARKKLGRMSKSRTRRAKVQEMTK